LGGKQQQQRQELAHEDEKQNRSKQPAPVRRHLPRREQEELPPIVWGEGGENTKNFAGPKQTTPREEPACDCGKPKDDKDEDETNLEGMHH